MSSNLPLTIRNAKRHGIRVNLPGLPMEIDVSVYLVEIISNDGTWGGRFFPKERAVVVYDNGNPVLTRAVVLHEIAHAHCYDLYNKGQRCSTRTRCGYSGEHDARFARVVNRLYKYDGTIPKNIMDFVEGK